MGDGGKSTKAEIIVDALRDSLKDHAQDVKIRIAENGSILIECDDAKLLQAVKDGLNVTLNSLNAQVNGNSLELSVEKHVALSVTFRLNRIKGNIAKCLEDKTPEIHKAIITTNTSDDVIASRIAELISAGADINAVDNDGRTALHLAVQKGNAKAVQALVTQGANLNVMDNKGLTPFALALEREEPYIIQIIAKNRHLFEDVRDADGKNVVDHAKELGDQRLVARLKANGFTDKDDPIVGVSEPDPSTVVEASLLRTAVRRMSEFKEKGEKGSGVSLGFVAEDKVTGKTQMVKRGGKTPN
jgi:hypothetical protein